MDGSRRVRATSVLPGYGPTCLFKGHLGTKSNAVVDCSIPISVSTSIKYADQQRREKLKKELARYEKEFKAAVQANSKTNPKSFFNTIQKDPWKTFQAVPSLQRYSHTTCTGLALTPSGEPQDQDVLIEGVNGFPSFQKSLVPSSESQQLSLPKSDKIVVDGIENPGSSPCSADCTAFPPRKPSSRPKFCGRPRSTFPQSHRFQLVISKTPSRDLLDKHSELFSDKQLPFTPRTLKTEAKSFLSQYRYYTPAKRKKDFTDQRIEAETQTELSSFNSDFDTAETNNLTDSKVNPKQASNYMTYGTTEKTPLPLEGPGLPWQENKDGTLQQPSPSDEELSYLNFMQDVTNEILKLGLFSNRFLERLFERHIEQNKHHLKEEKMRHLLHGLKVDLGCTSEESLVKPNAEQNELKNERDIIIRQERQEYRKALDMLLCAPKVENEVSFQTEFFIPRYKTKYSDKVIIQQVNEEPSRWGEDNPDISDSLLDQETSVYVIEGDSDTEKVETSNDLCCLSTLPTKSVLFSRVKGGNSHDRELPTLKIMKMSIEDCPSEV